MAEIGWRLAPLDDPGLPDFIAHRGLPDPTTARWELHALLDSAERTPSGGSGQMVAVLVSQAPDGSLSQDSHRSPACPGQRYSVAGQCPDSSKTGA
jgi:hypothetical protein